MDTPTDYSKCKIVNIRRGTGSEFRSNLIYAKLVDENGETIISATLDYIHDALAERLPK